MLSFLGLFVEDFSLSPFPPPISHASHILSVVHKEMIAAQELIVVATDLAHQVLALAGRHENVVLRDQLSMLKKDLGDSQQEYRRCIASHSQDNAGEVHRGYKLEPDSGPNRDVKAIERDARKRRLLNAPTTSNWLLLESLAPKPLEPFDIVYAFPGSGGSYDPLKRDWRSLAHSVRSIVTYGASLHYGTIFVLLGPVVGAEQSALQHLRGMPVRYLQGDLASSLEHFRDHFVVLQDDVSFRRTIERSALWETSESWGALVALGVEPEQCWNKLTDALLDNVVASPGYKREARRCTTLQPIALNKPVVLHLLRTLVGPLPISSVRNCCDGSVDLVHLFAHWMYEHNLLGRATQDSRDVAISKDNEVDGGVSAQQGPLFMIGGRSTRELV